MAENVRKAVRDILTNYLETNKYRKTSERYEILDAAYSIGGQFAMDDLDKLLAEERHFPVSRATLYNAMTLFMEMRLIIRHRFQGRTMYEACYANTAHCHQVCTVCGTTTEIVSAEITKTVQNMRLKRFRMDGYTMYIYGVCSRCQAMITRKNNKRKVKKLES